MMSDNLLPALWDGMTPVETYRKVSEEHISIIDNTMKYLINPQASVRFITQSLSFNKEISVINSASANNVYRAQLKHMKLQVAADAIKSWCDIYCNTSSSLGQNQTTFISKCLNGIAECAESFQKSNKLDDVLPIYSHMMKELKENVECYATDMFETMNSVNSALEIWMKKNLEAYEAEDKYPSKTPRITGKTEKSV